MTGRRRSSPPPGAHLHHAHRRRLHRRRPSKTYIVNPPARSAPTSSPSARRPSIFGRATDIAAFDGAALLRDRQQPVHRHHTGLTYSISGNTAANQGNSYEIFSNLGAFLLHRPGRRHLLRQRGRRGYRFSQRHYLSVFPISGGQFTMPLSTPSPSPAARSVSRPSHCPAGRRSSPPSPLQPAHLPEASSPTPSPTSLTSASSTPASRPLSTPAIPSMPSPRPALPTFWSHPSASPPPSLLPSTTKLPRRSTRS